MWHKPAFSLPFSRTRLLIFTTIPILSFIACSMIFPAKASNAASPRPAQAKQLKTNDRVHDLDRTPRTTASSDRPIVTLRVVNVILTRDLTGDLVSLSRQELRDLSADMAAFENEVLTRTKADLRVKLVETVFDDSAHYSEGVDPDTMLSDMSLLNDTSTAAIRAVRARTNADVLMVIGGEMRGACGIANLNTSRSAKFAVGIVNSKCIRDSHDLTYPHEFGHALGLDHDRAIATGKHSNDDTNYGFVTSKSELRDVMSYDKACRKGSTCYPVATYANPKVTITMPMSDGRGHTTTKNIALGDGDNDAAHYINDSLRLYAAMNYNDGN